jgi:xanthine dehydrogenase accessory factor
MCTTFGPQRWQDAYLPDAGTLMSTSLQRLLPLFETELRQARSMVLATVLQTAGPTYTKAGAQMLIASNGEYAGLLSGGCLEGDLSERANRVFETGISEIVRYDPGGPLDSLFGLGSGCEGAMDILLQRLEPATQWQPLQRLAAARRSRRPERLLMVVRPTLPAIDASSATPPASWPAGCGIFLQDGEAFGRPPPDCLDALRRVGGALTPNSGSRVLPRALPGTDLLLLEQSAPPRLLLLGAGADALPVANLIGFLGWSLTVVDHRLHYARATRFPDADAVLAGGPAVLPDLLRCSLTQTSGFSGAIVMSHHLVSDLGYLRALAMSSIPYIGLLGPVARRHRLLADLDPNIAATLEPRLRSPVGLDIGADSPESIALSIVAEIHATLTGDLSLSPHSVKLTRPAPLRLPIR